MTLRKRYGIIICAADIKAEIAEFVKAKPENREESCRYDNKDKASINFKLKDFMNRIGG